MPDTNRTFEGPITSPQAEFDALRNVSPEAPCPYLPQRMARNEVYRADRLDGALYERLLARGFRRTGRLVYRPRCRGCQECRQIRVSVAEFAPTRSMRRVQRRNRDITVSVSKPTISDEKFDLFCRYLNGKHDAMMSRTFESFREFLYDSPLNSQEFCYSVGDRLVGVSIADKCPGGLSSVYMFFDPEFADRSPGTFSVLWEIEHCRQARLPYYYLGFYVAGSRTMAYKSRFAPCDLLVAEERWVTLRH